MLVMGAIVIFENLNVALRNGCKDEIITGYFTFCKIVTSVIKNSAIIPKKCRQNFTPE